MHMLGDKWAYAVSGRRENLEGNAAQDIRVSAAESASPRHKVSTTGSGYRAEHAVAHDAVAKHVRFAERKSATGVFIPAGMDVMKGVHEDVPVHREKGGAVELDLANHALQHQQQQQQYGLHPPPDLAAISSEGSASFASPSIIYLVNRSKHAVVDASLASPVIATPSAGVAQLLLQLPEHSTHVNSNYVIPSKISEERYGGGETSALHRAQQHQLQLQQQQQQQQDDDRQQDQQRSHIDYNLFDNRGSQTNVWAAVANAGDRRTPKSSHL